MSALEITHDWQRVDRLGFDEAVYCAGKSVPQIEAVLDGAHARHASLLLTRLDERQHAQLSDTKRQLIDYHALSRTAYFGEVSAPPHTGRVALVTAGTSDAPVASEAARTLGYYGDEAVEVHDVGVAGLWRLLERVDEIKAAPVTIVVAGMDGALPSVVAGLVPGAVIAAPTSVGYGATRGGETALCAALCSCAPGLVVVNIDNGYGAACAALRILNAFGTRSV